MGMESFKQNYRRFKQWQERPVQYHVMSEEEHDCHCCGYHYKGNYCPCCSQKASKGRVSWSSVHQDVLDIWELKNPRSILRSIWHLMIRPGYFISDYISGKCYASFAPVKMLFVLAIIYSFIAYWFLPNVLGVKLDPDYEEFMSGFMEWSRHHYTWQALGMAVLAIIPTYLMFRYAPRHTRHTLPEGFFIQVFLAVIGLVLSLILMPLRLIDPLVLSVAVSIITMVYYIVCYMQLFGYGLWGTLWRQGFIYLGIIGLTYAFIAGVFGINMGSDQTKDMAEMGLSQDGARALTAIGFLLFGLMSLGVGFVINFFASYRVREQSKRAVSQPKNQEMTTHS
jgi:hypothetical protein